MPLVSPVERDLDEETQNLIEFFNETLGFCPNSVLTMHHRPHIAKAFIQLNKAVMENQGRITSSLKRMVGYISSHAAGCRYCQAHTILAAERYGAETEKLNNIWDYRTHDAFSDAERVALDFALAASTIPNGVDQVIQERLQAYWSDGEIVELLGVIALFGYLNRWNDSMATSLESGAESAGERLLSKDDWLRGKHL